MISFRPGCGCGSRPAHRHAEGLSSLSLQVQEVLHRDPLGGHLFCFRGRRGNLLKVIWHDGQGRACSQNAWSGAASVAEPGRGVVTISPAQLGYLLSGIDWRHPQRRGDRHRSDDAFNLQIAMDVILSLRDMHLNRSPPILPPRMR